MRYGSVVGAPFKCFRGEGPRPEHASGHRERDPDVVEVLIQEVTMAMALFNGVVVDMDHLVFQTELSSALLFRASLQLTSSKPQHVPASWLETHPLHRRHADDAQRASRHCSQR